MKICTKCKRKLQETNFYLKRNKLRPQCKDCFKKEVFNRQQKLRKLINSYKKECLHCGYNKCKEALDFHHENETEKEFTLSKGNRYNINKIIEELDKCIVLCANCHRELHSK